MLLNRGTASGLSSVTATISLREYTHLTTLGCFASLSAVHVCVLHLYFNLCCTCMCPTPLLVRTMLRLPVSTKFGIAINNIDISEHEARWPAVVVRAARA